MLNIDYLGYTYETASGPAFVNVSAKNYLHRPTMKLYDKPAMDSRWAAESYTPGTGEVGSANAWLLAHTGIVAAAAPPPPSTGVAPAASLFVATSFPASGATGGVGHIDPHFTGKTLNKAATLTITATLTGTGAGTFPVVVALTNKMTGAQAEAAIVAAWNAVAGLAVAPASAGTGTIVDVTPAAGTIVASVTFAVV